MKTMIKRFITLLSIAIFPVSLSAQTISGKVTDKNTGEALSYTNVLLLNASDSSYITGTVTGENGSFAIDAQQKKCLLQVSFLGYETFLTAVTSNNMGTIGLEPKGESLEAAVVKATAKTFKMENGGITADVQNSRLKDMGSAPEILGQLPFVLQQDNSYTVLGKGAPVFYINNRLVRDNNELRELDAKLIKRITVITDPGAEYDASVNAVIKIETSRPTGEGFSGSLSGYNRINKKFSTLETLSLNYRTGKLDIFGSFQYFDMQFPKDRVITDEIFADTTQRVETSSTQNDKMKRLIPKGGFNFMVNENHSFGAQYEYNDINMPSRFDGNTDVFLNNVRSQQLRSDYNASSNDYSHYTNAYYNGQMGKWLNVKLDMDYKTNKGNSKNTSNTWDEAEQEKLISSGSSDYNLYAAKLTLSTPLWNGSLVYGGEGSRTTNKQNFEIEENTGIPGVVASDNESKQNLFAGFVSFGRAFGNISGNIGLRYEDIRFKYYLNGEYVTEQSKNYRRLFPSLRLSYNNKDVQMQLAYRQTVSRPGYGELRGTVSYTSPYLYYSGNPLLQPSYKNSLSYTLMWKRLMFSAVYDRISDHIAEYWDIYMDNSILIRPVNLDKEQLTLSVNYGPTIGVWKPNVDVSMTKDYLTYGNPEQSFNDPMFSVNFRNSVKLGKWTTGADVWMRSAGNRNMETNEFTWMTGVYVTRSFFKDNLWAFIRVNDIFNTANDVMEFRYAYANSRWDNKMFRRNITIQFTYRFNATKDRYKGSRASDELDRL